MQWKQGDFPFLYVQIAPYKDMTPEIREAQFLTLSRSPNTAMAVITDAGDAEDIHPADKKPVGRRLALAARALAYGQDIEYSGPLLGFYKLSKALLYFSLPLFVIALFLGNPGWHLIYIYLIIVLLISVVKNTNPRLRIKDILKVFWFILFPLGCLGIILAVLGY